MKLTELESMLERVKAQSTPEQWEVAEVFSVRICEDDADSLVYTAPEMIPSRIRGWAPRTEAFVTFPFSLIIAGVVPN